MRRLMMSRLIWIYTVCKNLLSSPMAVKELIYNMYVFPGDYNIALYKPTRQFPYDFCKECVQWKNTCTNCATSDRAVDGNADPDTLSEHCSHTEDSQLHRPASWSVDFQGLYYLSRIIITNRLDGKWKLVKWSLKCRTLWANQKMSIQSTLVISTSLISSKNLVPILTWKSNNR